MTGSMFSKGCVAACCRMNCRGVPGGRETSQDMTVVPDEKQWGPSPGSGTGGEWTDRGHIKELESEGPGSRGRLRNLNVPAEAPLQGTQRSGEKVGNADLRMPPMIRSFFPLWIFTALVRGRFNF